jgi:hypothetical protein
LFCAASSTHAKHTRPDDCLNKALAGIRWCCWSAARVCSATPDGPPGICLVPSTRRQPPPNSGSVRAFPFQILLRSSATKARRGHNGSVAYSRRSARSRLCSRLFLSRAHIQAKTGARAASLAVADSAGRAPMKFTSLQEHIGQQCGEKRRPDKPHNTQPIVSVHLASGINRGGRCRKSLDLGQ